MKKKHFPDYEDFTTSDIGLIAMVDVIRATLDNYVSNLQSRGKKVVFKNVPGLHRSICMRLRICCVIFIRSFFLFILETVESKQILNRYIEVDKDFEINMPDLKINWTGMNQKYAQLFNK